ncbi:hypothetical protein KRR38_30530 [Novosphingobium sp. G106]|uniref:hypothetical protein n=1 Tax=Novosphingobium sp. G106 TaxID=2849500 RepID=UPI001C2D8318|nr:hypothetical protein [Novosphingobium sp. G106]MBV1691886.1 hypothetical protein [Novosphingobium sp. G106]
MNELAGDAFLALMAALGAAFMVKAATIRDAIARRYDNPRITAHLHMRGYVLSLRLVGTGWFLFGGAILIAKGVRFFSV